MTARSFHVVFQNFHDSFKHSVGFINTSVTKYWRLDLKLDTIVPLGYISATLGYLPLPHHEFTISFDFILTSVKTLNRKRSHIGVRIFIRIKKH